MASGSTEELENWPLLIQNLTVNSVLVHASEAAQTLSLTGFENEQSQSLSFSIEAALGSYPDGARVLKGHDKSYIIAPIGHLVEESYSPYLQFNPPAVYTSWWWPHYKCSYKLQTAASMTKRLSGSYRLSSKDVWYCQLMQVSFQGCLLALRTS